jgi:hypothetical protein
MAKFIVRWDAGYGDDYEVVEAENEEEALSDAHDFWKETVEANADYEVIGEATDELLEEHIL